MGAVHEPSALQTILHANIILEQSSAGDHGRRTRSNAHCPRPGAVPPAFPGLWLRRLGGPHEDCRDPSKLISSRNYLFYMRTLETRIATKLFGIFMRGKQWLIGRVPLAPDLNQRVQDWLHQETRSSFAMENPVPSAWPSQMPVATRNDPCAVTSEYQPPSSSDNSSSYTIRSIPKVLSGLKARRAPCLDLEDHRVGSKSLETLQESDPETVERGVT